MHTGTPKALRTAIFVLLISTLGWAQAPTQSKPADTPQAPTKESKPKKNPPDVKGKPRAGTPTPKVPATRTDAGVDSTVTVDIQRTTDLFVVGDFNHISLSQIDKLQLTPNTTAETSDYRLRLSP